MISFPNCKINLGLSVTKKRDDGFHELDTVFYPVQLNDALEFVEHDTFKFECSGINIPGNEEDNLIVKAYQLLCNDFPQIKPLHIHLLKNIPTGGGLGGGSSDASHMLQMLNNYFNLNLSTTQIATYALQLGSDCPFFIYNTPCHATGRGELLHPITLDLSEYNIVLVLPGIHIPTGWAFAQLNPHAPVQSTINIIQQPIETWKDHLVNDFEAPVFSLHTMLQEIKLKLYDLGAVYSSMSGSGSSMYGFFYKEHIDQVKQQINQMTMFQNMQCYFI